MAYNHKKLGKLVAEVLESGGYVHLHKLDCNGGSQNTEQALSFLDRAREVLKVEDNAIIVNDYEHSKSCGYYSTNNESLTIRISSSFYKPSTEDDKS